MPSSPFFWTIQIKTYLSCFLDMADKTSGELTMRMSNNDKDCARTEENRNSGYNLYVKSWTSGATFSKFVIMEVKTNGIRKERY